MVSLWDEATKARRSARGWKRRLRPVATFTGADRRAQRLEAIPTLEADQQGDPGGEVDVTQHPSLLSTVRSRVSEHDVRTGQRRAVYHGRTFSERRQADGPRAIILLRGGPCSRRRTAKEDKAEAAGKDGREARRRWWRRRERKERRKCPLRPLSSFEVHERLRRTKRRRSGYSLPFLLSRGVLPFPVEARTGEPLHGPFTITIIVRDGREGRQDGGGTRGGSLKTEEPIDRSTAVSRPPLPPPAEKVPPTLLSFSLCLLFGLLLGLRFLCLLLRILVCLLLNSRNSSSPDSEGRSPLPATGRPRSARSPPVSESPRIGGSRDHRGFRFHALQPTIRRDR